MDTRPSLLPEIGPDGLAREAPVIAYTEKVIEEEQLQLKRYIEENYSKIRDVEREFANLTMELKLTAGPKKAALELLRKKIESSTERIRAAKAKEEQARKMWEAALKVVQDEEEVKQKLCDDLNCLVQESTTSQFSRLEELKRRLEALNPTRASTFDAPVPQGGKLSSEAKSSSGAPNDGAQSHLGEKSSQKLDSVQNHGNVGNDSMANGRSPSMLTNDEERGKKRTLNLGRGKGNVGPKGRGLPGSGWTGAGFDMDGRT
ncbi:hypothetical protein H6P81_005022 [Aristolochia fimbriata]|uniref:RAB6-interacting golgin n=1 Tax=Aristolochia fimbriata TaxID=158543 RepID=A0AAV7EXS8_ARIFI|nr:hypothetical protein H6P81_005022 [Aristolochia fimbriata]